MVQNFWPNIFLKSKYEKQNKFQPILNTNIRVFCDLLSCGSLGPHPFWGYKLDKGLTLMEVLIFFFEKT